MKFYLGSRDPFRHFSGFMMHTCFELTAGLTFRSTYTDALFEKVLPLLRHLIPSLERRTLLLQWGTKNTCEKVFYFLNYQLTDLLTFGKWEWYGWVTEQIIQSKYDVSSCLPRSVSLTCRALCCHAVICCCPASKFHSVTCKFPWYMLLMFLKKR